jgi:hypothetical protein
MKTFLVTMPITGVLVREVKAESESEAINMVLNGEIPGEREVSISDVESWSMHHAIVTGNVFHGEQNRANAEALDDEDADISGR